jgi:hypothetical protein
MLKIWPLAITQAHFPTLIKVCQDELGYSPTRGLDVIGINTDSPSAYLACIGLDNKPLDQLRTGHNRHTAWKHASVSFIAITKAKLVIQLTSICGFHVLPKGIPDSDDYLIIITGNMCQWREGIIKGCRFKDRLYKDLRVMMNYCLVYLQEAGFREIWHDCEKQSLEDGTFILKS